MGSAARNRYAHARSSARRHRVRKRRQRRDTWFNLHTPAERKKPTSARRICELSRISTASVAKENMAVNKQVARSGDAFVVEQHVHTTYEFDLAQLRQRSS